MESTDQSHYFHEISVMEDLGDWTIIKSNTLYLNYVVEDISGPMKSRLLQLFG